MKNIFRIFLVLALSKQMFAQKISCQAHKQTPVPGQPATAPANLRSDTFDVLHYHINLDITNFGGQSIAGFTTVKITPKINNRNFVMLDLLGMTIDSTKITNQLVSWQYNDTLLKVTFPVTKNTGDTFDVQIFYHGVPKKDPSNWGGFYFMGNYAFNLGVGFQTKPHNFGRAWFPCFDNFAERSKYTFTIKSNGGKTSYCNGYLVKDSLAVNGDRIRVWKMDDEIPTYLASVAVAPYTEVNQNFTGINGIVPVKLAALATDTSKLKNSFVNLENAFDCFESSYGPYIWNRVGYALVPFTSGAMEHATNIAYPAAAANNTLAYEDILMAHELSHHWWGDQVTCETAEDMWINEGMATYSAFLFNECVYGKTVYLKKIRDNHDENLHYLHHKEGGFRVISQIPHDLTYGDHVYNKGADIAHTMRGYLGDSAFFAGLKYTLLQKTKQNMNSSQFQQLMATGSGKNTSDFFNNWVFAGGWPEFRIDSVIYSGTAPNISATIYIKQHLFGAPSYYTNVPMVFSFMDNNRNFIHRRGIVSGQYSTVNFTIPFLPVFACNNLNGEISDAVSNDQAKIYQTGAISFLNGRVNINTLNAGNDTSFILAEHHFVAPDPIKNNVNNYRLGNQRYWKIGGQLANGFRATGRFYFNGYKALGSGAGGAQYLDTSLMVSGTCDSLIILYRANAADDWKEVKGYTRVKIGNQITSLQGYVQVDTLKLGEYCFANGISQWIGLNENKLPEGEIKIFPNPGNGEFTIQPDNFQFTGSDYIEVTDVNGKLVLQQVITKSQTKIDISKAGNGTYFVILYSKGKAIRSGTVIKE